MEGDHLGAEMMAVNVLDQRIPDTDVDSVPGEYRHQLTSRRQEQVDQTGAGRDDVLPDDHHLVARDREAVTGLAGPRPGEGLLGSHPHRPVPGPAAALAMV